MSNMNITREDIDLLVREPSPSIRVRITDKIATGYNAGVFSESETKLANEIFRLLLKDTEVKVRRLMAERLKSNMQVPHDVVWGLANDKPVVACAMLQYSHVLREDDLVAIARATSDSVKLQAIARRESISRELSHALVQTRARDVTRELLANRNAQLAETSLELVLDEFARDHDVMEELVVRGGLSYAFAEKVFAHVSDSLKKQLTRKYRLSRHVVEEVTVNARETAVLQFMSPWMSQHEINLLVDQMYRHKRLTDSAIIRSLCIGDLRFFETAIAKRVGIPISNARILLIDPGPLGFKALYESARLPASFYKAVHAMLHFALEETQYGHYRTTDFCQRMVERITEATQFTEIEHMDTLLTMIGAAIYDRPTIH
jgi:uncharacterized protein (DUF2336 family)